MHTVKGQLFFAFTSLGNIEFLFLVPEVDCNHYFQN